MADPEKSKDQVHEEVRKIKDLCDNFNGDSNIRGADFFSKVSQDINAGKYFGEVKAGCAEFLSSTGPKDNPQEEANSSQNPK